MNCSYSATPRALALGVEAADELRIHREIGEHAPARDALGAEDDVEVRAGAQPAGGLERRRDAVARRPDGHRRLDRHDRRPPARSPAPIAAQTASTLRQSGSARASTYSGGTATTRSGPSATAAVVSVVARRRPAATASRQRLLQPRLAGKRRAAGVDELDGARVDVAADDLVPGARDVRRQRQAHLAERDDDRPHPVDRLAAPSAHRLAPRSRAPSRRSARSAGPPRASPPATCRRRARSRRTPRARRAAARGAAARSASSCPRRRRAAPARSPIRT